MPAPFFSPRAARDIRSEKGGLGGFRSRQFGNLSEFYFASIRTNDIAGAYMLAKDQNLLDKLFDVESKAESLVADARKEADRKVASAKDRAEAEIAAAHESALKDASERKAAAAAAVLADYEKAVASFRSSLDATRVDEAAFKATCEVALAKK